MASVRGTRSLDARSSAIATVIKISTGHMMTEEGIGKGKRDCKQDGRSYVRLVLPDNMLLKGVIWIQTITG